MSASTSAEVAVTTVICTLMFVGALFAAFYTGVDACRQQQVAQCVGHIK